jgi:hypothetical protein
VIFIQDPWLYELTDRSASATTRSETPARYIYRVSDNNGNAAEHSFAASAISRRCIPLVSGSS